MMKKNYALLFLMLFNCSFALAQDTMDDFKKQFKNKSIDEIKELLVEQNKELAGMIKLSSLSIKLTSGDAKAGETTTTEKFSEEPALKITKAFNKKLDGLSFSSNVVYPNTLLGIDYSSSSLQYSVNDYDDYKFPEPTLKLKKVYFANGKTANFDQPILGRNAEKADEIKGTNLIDSVELEASYYYPERISFVTLKSKNALQKVKDGKIILVDLKGNSADLKISPEVKAQVIKVEGINNKGEAISQSSYSSSSMTSNFSTAYLQSIYKTSENVIAKINKQQYKDKDELVADLFNNLPKADKEKPEQFVNASYSFRGEITGINVFFKPTGKIQNYNFTLKNRTEAVDGFIIAENKKELFGILDDKGKWFINPTYERLNFYKGNYFLGKVGADGYQQILWLDKTNAKLVPMKYRFYRNDAFFDTYYSIEDGVNGPKGLVNLKTNEVVMPPIHDNIYVEGSYIVITKRENEERVILDQELKEVLKLKGQSFKINGNYIVVDKPYTKKEKFADYSHLSNTQDVYNQKGQKINKEDYVIDSYDFFGVDSLLLAKTQAGKNVYINTKGDVVIDAAKYTDAKVFSNGLAAVKNQQDDWGYINAKGEVIIPFAYHEAGAFSKISAMVKSANGYMLIDKKNKIIKKFDDGFSSYQTGKDRDNLEYRNYDGKTYNSDGNVKMNKD